MGQVMQTCVLCHMRTTYANLMHAIKSKKVIKLFVLPVHIEASLYNINPQVAI